MKLNGIDSIEQFNAALDEAKGDVWLLSIYGDRFNLKSFICRNYIIYDKLLNDMPNDLELFCSKKEDEGLFYRLFHNKVLVN